MYNRYVPQSDGTYRRNVIPDRPVPPPPPQPSCPPPTQEPPCPPPKPPKPEPKPHFPPPRQNAPAGDFLRGLLPRNLDTGDLLILLLLLLMAGDCREDRNTALLTLALYLFM